MQSTQRNGTLPYVSGPPYTAPLPYAAYTAHLPYAAMPALSARPTLPMGYYGQGNQFPLMPNPNWMMTERESRCYNSSSSRKNSNLKLGELAKPSLSLSPPSVHWGSLLRLGTMLILMQGGQPVLKGLDLKTRSLTKLNVPGLLQHLADPPLPRGTVPTLDVASNCDDIPPGPEDQSEGEIIDSEGDPADAGIPILDNLKMSEEEQRDYDAFSLFQCLSDLGGLRRIRRFRSFSPRTFLLLARLAL